MPNPENIKGKGFDKNPENINRKGRPKSFKGLTATLKDVIESDGSMLLTDVYELDDEHKETGNVFKNAKVKIPRADMIILTALRLSMKGDMRAIEFIFNRIEGMPKQQIDFGAEEPLAEIKVKLIE